jgi:hypothetical protein
MKRARTGSQLLESLDDDLGWRVKEISALRSAIRSANGSNQVAMLRAAIPILYAHWEGYIKFSAATYCGYLSSLNLRFGDIRQSFCGLKALAHVKTLHAITKRVFVASSLLEQLVNIDTEKVEMQLERYVGNVGNLNFDVFEQIAEFLSLDVAGYSGKRMLIDESLLKLRNEIAHGEHLLIDVEGFELLSNEIIGLTRQFKTDIQNAVALKSYLKPSTPVIVES